MCYQWHWTWPGLEVWDLTYLDDSLILGTAQPDRARVGGGSETSIFMPNRSQLTQHLKGVSLAASQVTFRAGLTSQQQEKKYWCEWSWAQGTTQADSNESSQPFPLLLGARYGRPTGTTVRAVAMKRACFSCVFCCQRLPDTDTRFYKLHRLKKRACVKELDLFTSEGKLPLYYNSRTFSCSVFLPCKTVFEKHVVWLTCVQDLHSKLKRERMHLRTNLRTDGQRHHWRSHKAGA